MHLSAVIITFNEEKNIARCLESLQGVAEEIIVVDSFSTDKTKEICEAYGVKFVQRSWTGYSDQKNHANGLASTEYILSIDADEVLSAELQQSITRLQEPYADAYGMNRLTSYCGHWIHHCGWYPDHKIRIFKKGIAQWKGLIHETLHFEKQTKVVALKGDLLHYSFHTMGQYVRQQDKFTDLTAETAFSKGKKTSSWGVFLRPKWRFFRDFILKKGFLDGKWGYQVCKIMAFATFMKYVKLQQLHTQNKQQNKINQQNKK